MSLIHSWDMPSEQEEQPQQEEQKSFIDSSLSNIGNFGNAVKADFSRIGVMNDKNDILQRLQDGDYADRDEYNGLLDKYRELESASEYANNQYNENHQALKDNGSVMTDFDQMGGTGRGMAYQYGASALGAGLGALAAGPAGAKVGWNIGTGVGGALAGWDDNKSNAIEARMRVLEEGGSPDDAQEAYDRALAYGAPLSTLEGAGQAYLANKIGGAVMGKFAKTPLKGVANTVAKGVSKINNFDIPSRVATGVANKLGSRVAGQVAGTLATGALGYVGEGTQEVGQNWATDRAVNDVRQRYAPDKYNPDAYTLTGYNWMSPENRETFRVAGKSGALFGALGGAVGSRSMLQDGTAIKGNIQRGKALDSFLAKPEIQEKYPIDTENLNDMKENLAVQLGVDEEEAKGWTPAQTLMRYVELHGNREENGRLVYDDAKANIATNDFINHLFKNQDTTTSGTMSNASVDFYKSNGMSRVEGMYSPSERQALEGQQQTTSTGTEQQTSYTSKQTTSTDNVTQANDIVKGLNKEIPQESIQNKAKVATDDGASPNKPTIIAKGKAFANDAQPQSLSDNLGSLRKEPKRTVQGFEQKGDIYRDTDGTVVTVEPDPVKAGTFQVGREGSTVTENWGTKEETEERLKNGERPDLSEAVAQDSDTNKLDFLSSGGENIVKDANEDDFSTGTTVHNQQDLTKYFKAHRSGVGAMSPRMYGELSEAMMRFKGKPVDYRLALDTFAENGNGGQVAGAKKWVNLEDGTKRAVLSLYYGADVFTAVHEVAHVGFDLLSERQKRDFMTYAIASQPEYICNYMGVEFTKENVAQIMDSNTELGKRFNAIDDGVMTQTKALLYPNRTDSALYSAVRERFAHEFSLFYARGMEMGTSSDNIRKLFFAGDIKGVFRVALRTISEALGVIRFTSEYLNSDGWQTLKGQLETSPLTMFENMNQGPSTVQGDTKEIALRDGSDVGFYKPTKGEPETKPRLVKSEGQWRRLEKNGFAKVSDATLLDLAKKLRDSDDELGWKVISPELTKRGYSVGENFEITPTQNFPAVKGEQGLSTSDDNAGQRTAFNGGASTQVQDGTVAVQGQNIQNDIQDTAKYLAQKFKGNPATMDSYIKRLLASIDSNKNMSTQQKQEEAYVLMRAKSIAQQEVENNGTIIMGDKNATYEGPQYTEENRLKTQSEVKQEKPKKEKTTKAKKQKTPKQPKTVPSPYEEKETINKPTTSNKQILTREQQDAANKGVERMTKDLDKRTTATLKDFRKVTEKTLAEVTKNNFGQGMTMQQGILDAIDEELTKRNGEETTKQVYEQPKTTQKKGNVVQLEDKEADDNNGTTDQRGTKDIRGIKEEVQERQGSTKTDRTGNQGKETGLGTTPLGLRNVLSKKIEKLVSKLKLAKDIVLKDSRKHNDFYSIHLDEAIHSNDYGGYVSPHTAKELNESGAYTMITPNGQSGIAVEKNGNITGAFSYGENQGKNAVRTLLIAARAKGGIKMDCYGRELVNMYERAGFVPVARVLYNGEYVDATKSENKMLVKNKPDVYALMATKESLEEVVRKMENGEYHISSQAELDALKTFGKEEYEAGLAYRDKLYKEQGETTTSVEEKPKVIATKKSGLSTIFSKSNTLKDIITNKDNIFVLDKESEQDWADDNSYRPYIKKMNQQELIKEINLQANTFLQKNKQLRSGKIKGSYEIAGAEESAEYARRRLEIINKVLLGKENKNGTTKETGTKSEQKGVATQPSMSTKRQESTDRESVRLGERSGERMALNENPAKTQGKTTETEYQFVGRTFNPKVADQALKDIKNGTSEYEVYKKSKGWFRGVDGKMRLYVPDKMDKIKIPKVLDGAKWNGKINGVVNTQDYQDSKGHYGSITLGEIYDYPELYKFYPEFKNMEVRFLNKDYIGQDKYGALYSHETKTTPAYIAISKETYDSPSFSDSIKKIKRLKLENSIGVKAMFSPETSLIHEIQHAIQYKEGFASGGDQDTVNSIYETSFFSVAKSMSFDVELGKDIDKKLNEEDNLFERAYIQDYILADKSIVEKCLKVAKKNPVLFGMIENMAKQSYNKIKSDYYNSAILYKNLPYEVQTQIDDHITRLNDLIDIMVQDNLSQYKALSGEKEARQTEHLATEKSLKIDKNSFEHISGLYDYKNGLTIIRDKKDRIKSRMFGNSMIAKNEIINENKEIQAEKNREQFAQLLLSPDTEFSEAVVGKQVQDDKKNAVKILPIRTILGGSVSLQSKPESGVIDHRGSTYKVTFTPTALHSTNNQKLVSQFEEAVQEWKKTTNPDGSVTFERNNPQKHQIDEITYNGINGKDLRTTRQKLKDRAQTAVIRYLFNDKEDLARVARESGCWEAYMRMMVLKDQGNVATSAMESGIKTKDGKTAALNDIIDKIGEVDQWDFLEYCEAKRVIDLANREQAVYQKMTVDEAKNIIKEVESGTNAEKWIDQHQKLMEYNRALLHVLVDGHILSQSTYDFLVKQDPNYIPLNKVMDGDIVSNIGFSKSLINTKNPLHKIKGSLREIKNPFLQIQENTAKFYADSARNAAARTFVKEIAEATTTDENGKEVRLNGALCKELAVPEESRKNLTPDEKQRVFFIWDTVKDKDGNERAVKKFYQCSDQFVYNALRSFDETQTRNIGLKAIKAVASVVRKTATSTLDFAVRNVVRDNFEAFLTSEHGYIPIYDFAWGVKQIMGDTPIWREFQSLNGEMLTRTKDGKTVASSGRSRSWNSLMKTFTSQNIRPELRAKAALKLMTFPLKKGLNKLEDFNNVGEMATRLAEYKNARMGYDGLFLGDNSRFFGETGAFNSDMSQAKHDKYFGAYQAKEVTLNFGQHGKLGAALNPYVPFFNASLQGAYKVCRILADLSGRKGKSRALEVAFKGVIIGAAAMALHSAGHGNKDYDEAPDYEWKRFWIFPNGMRLPKDQVFGQSIGTTVEMVLRQNDKDGKVNKFDLLKNVLGTFAPDNYIPTIATLFAGMFANYDTYKEQNIVPYYMKDKLGHLHTDINTSNIAADVSNFLWNSFGIDVSSKKLDWYYRTQFSNSAKYANALYDVMKDVGHWVAPKSIKATNPKMDRGSQKGNELVGALKDKVPRGINQITGTFTTNNTSYQSISDFHKEFDNIKKYVTTEGKGKSKKVIIAKDSSGKPMISQGMWKRYSDADKQMKLLNKELKAIRENDKLTGAQKRKKADPIFNKQIKLAKWAKGVRK